MDALFLKSIYKASRISQKDGIIIALWEMSALLFSILTISFINLSPLNNSSS